MSETCVNEEGIKRRAHLPSGCEASSVPTASPLLLVFAFFSVGLSAPLTASRLFLVAMALVEFALSRKAFYELFDQENEGENEREGTDFG